MILAVFLALSCQSRHQPSIKNPEQERRDATEGQPAIGSASAGGEQGKMTSGGAANQAGDSGFGHCRDFTNIESGTAKIFDDRYLCLVEKRIGELANDIRKRNKVKSLRYFEELGDAARYWSREQAKMGDAGHGNAEQKRDKQYYFTSRYPSLQIKFRGENVAYLEYFQHEIAKVLDNPDLLAQDLVKNWQESPRHLQNIINLNFVSQGSGVYFILLQRGKSKIYRVYGTHIFAN